jgi:hypothetical protein
MFDFGGLLDFTYYDLVFSCSISIYKRAERAEYLIRHSARVVGELELDLPHDVNVSELFRARYLDEPELRVHLEVRF